MHTYTLSTSAAVFNKPHNLGTILPRTSRLQWGLAGDAARFVIGAPMGSAGVDVRLSEFDGTQLAPGQLYAKGASPKG
jgi:hypothetical protein